MRRLVGQYAILLPQLANQRATKIFLGALLLWLFIFQYCRFKLWRDPHSAFFNDRHVYDLGYSLYRERQGQHFISQFNSPSDPPKSIKGGSDPLVCVSFVTIRRKLDNYFDPSIGSLLEGLDDKERRALHLNILFADTDPTRHPSWGQEWLTRLVDSAGQYNVSETELKHLQVLEKEENFYEKGVFDYTYALESCQQTNAPYTIIFEDDIILATGWFTKTLEALSQLSPKDNWIYLRLFYTETAFSWSTSDVAYRNMPFIFAFLMLLALSCLLLLRRFRLGRSYLDYTSIAVVCLVCVPAFTALVYMMGKYTLMPLRGVVEMNKSGCCTQGILFPKDQVNGLIGFLKERGHGQTDSMIEEYSDKSGLTRYALAPPQLQHVGLKSSRNNLDINTQSTWAFWFEENDPVDLDEEHKSLLQDEVVQMFLDGY
ncbi:uncharacterized protein KD926_003707 [Aspergillus affinis]|uniref:uncharacterized protein n=1 Tax=Aspergillus affinis TaxID=1070780 RepID=UPI0022FEB597|nr:uncharacterized protein KD926_003707 [Aspergillus affinis]KAI9035346.1 hypothetical protein KD926_003707 [Aspergillus affinis]